MTESENVQHQLDQGLQALGVEPVAADDSTRTTATRAVTRSSVRGGRSVTELSLQTRGDDVFHWDILGEPATRSIRSLQRYRFEELAPNEITEKLVLLDNRLTPNQGLRQLTSGNLNDSEAEPIASGRVLLLVHGTFSNSENVVEDLKSTAVGRSFLEWADANYDQLVAFGHPTLSVSPILNALVLARAFSGSQTEVDVVCHSRGGLVVRWWLEALAPSSSPRRRAVFVGSPLAGTGLAAPDRLRQTLDLLASFSRQLATCATTASALIPFAAPMFQLSALMAGVLSSAATIGSKTPLLDAMISLVPGLAAQSRQGANAELLGLRAGFDSSTREHLLAQARRYAFVISNFEPEAPGWRFWRHFRKDQLANHAADFVFEGANDLVVDTPSMTDLADTFQLSPDDARNRVLDFATNERVHHCNYFRMPETLQFIQDFLARES
ncbi:MAG: hypothetical protein KDB14_22775 [Planctomycetales bacterium]|nr:hypothetical protein [Planctomycetales bacterium]